MAKNIIDLSETSTNTLNKVKGIGLVGSRIVRTKEDSVNLAIEILGAIIDQQVLTEFELGNLIKRK
jgi:hypothetical protein